MYETKLMLMIVVFLLKNVKRAIFFQKENFKLLKSCRHLTIAQKIELRVKTTKTYKAYSINKNMMW